MSASTMIEMFSKYGDFHLYKDTLQSCIINFYHIDKDALEDNTPQGFIKMLSGKKAMEEFKIETVCPYDQAPKFVAHDRLE